jgi:transposase
MTKMVRARYTLEFKQRAVQMVQAGYSVVAVARDLRLLDRTLYSWVKAERQGKLKGSAATIVSAEQMAIRRLHKELTLVRTEINALKESAESLRTEVLQFARLHAESPRADQPQ